MTEEPGQSGVRVSVPSYISNIMSKFDLIIHVLNIMSIFLVKILVLKETAQTLFGGVKISLLCSVSEFQA